MLFVFFFKQKTAYEMLRSLVGSEMCIRDRGIEGSAICHRSICHSLLQGSDADQFALADSHHHCLLYTSDAADDLLCVDLGGRRIIKKKNNEQHRHQTKT